MKLYQALTQVTIDNHLLDTYTDFKVTTQLKLPLNYAPEELYAYIESVLAPGSFHTQNNLRYVTDPSFISSNFDFQGNPFTAQFQAFEDKVAFAQKVVADLNRHLSINLDLEHRSFQLNFVD